MRRRAGLLRWSVALLVLAGVPVTAAAAGSKSTTASAVCSLQSVMVAPPLARDCVIRGTVHGETIDSRGSADVTWSGTLVLRLKEGDPGDERRYLVTKGSSVDWTYTEVSPDGCNSTGSGTLDATHLGGYLRVGERVREVGTKVRTGVWHYGLEISPRGTLAVTNCRGEPAGIGFTADVVDNLGYTAGHNVETDGQTFSGQLTAGPATVKWALVGWAFAHEISEYGIDFLKRWEALAERCTRDGRKAARGPYVCAYNDKPDDPKHGNCTIGYGHLAHGGKGPCTAADLRLRWTPERADKELRREVKLDRYEGNVRAFSARYGLNQCQFDALMSYVYNTSPKSWKSLTTGLNPKKAWEAQILQRLLKFNTAGGVVLEGLAKRRAAEFTWFATPHCPCQGVKGPPLPPKVPGHAPPNPKRPVPPLPPPRHP